jgi:hypothetical protein
MLASNLSDTSKTDYLYYMGSQLNVSGAYTPYYNDGTYINTWAIDAGTSTVTFNGAADQTVRTANQSFYNLTINNTGTAPTNDVIPGIGGETLDVNGDLTVTDGNLSLSDYDMAVNIGGSLVVDSGGSVSNAGYTGTITFDGTTAAVINSYNSITLPTTVIDGTAKRLTLMTQDPATTTLTTVTVGTDDFLNLNGYNFGATTLNNNGTIELAGNENLAVSAWDTNSGTTTYNGVGTYSSLPAGGTYNHLNFASSASGSWSPAGNLIINGNLFLDAGTLSPGGQSVTVAGKAYIQGGIYAGAGPSGGIFTVNGGNGDMALTVSAGTLTAPSGGVRLSDIGTNGYTHTGGTVDWVTNSAVLYLDTNGGPVLPAETYYDLLVSELMGPAGPYLTGSTTIHSLTLTSGEAGSVFTVGDYVLNVNGDIYIDPSLVGGASSELVIGSGTVNIHGGWDINHANASVSAGTGSTVNFIGTGPHSIEGSTSFYNLGIFDQSNDAADVVATFTTWATSTARNTLTITGIDDSDRVNLRSATPGTYWYLTADGTLSVNWVDAQDSNASGGNTISHSNGVDSGHNVNWGFDVISILGDDTTLFFDSHAPGVWATTTSEVYVYTENASGFYLSINRDNASAGLVHQSDPAYTIPDKTAWEPGANCSLAGNASASTTEAETLSFRVLQTGTDASNYCGAWWGSNDSSGALYAGLPATLKYIAIRSSASVPTTTTKVIYNIKTPPLQISGTYSGDITFTATAQL